MRVGDDWHLQIVEETLDQASDHVGVFHFLQTFVITGSQQGQNLVLLIHCHALPENALQLKSVGLAFEVANQVLQNQRNAQLAQLEVLDRVDFLLNEGFNRQLKLSFFLTLFFSPGLSIEVDSEICQRSSLLEALRKLLGNGLRNEFDKILEGELDFLAEFFASLEHLVVLTLEGEVYRTYEAHELDVAGSFDDDEGAEVFEEGKGLEEEEVLELKEVVRRGGLMVEVDEDEGLAGPA